MRQYILLLLSILISCHPLAGTTILYSPRPDNDLDAILRLIDDDVERDQVGELLLRLTDAPLDINHASEDELLALPFFDAFYVRNLLLYRSRYGGLISLYDLKNIQGAPTSYLPLLEPYLALSPLGEKSSNIGQRTSFFVGSELSLRRNEAQSYRMAPAWMVDSRSQEGWSWSLFGENDRGESYQPLRSGVFDHFSFSINRYLEKAKLSLAYTPRSQIIMGDMRVTIGQGLLMGMGLSHFSRLEYRGGPPPLHRNPLRPHRSFREYGFLRGVGVTQRLGHTFGFSAFAGYEPVDARLEGSQILTLYSTGLHRTDRELLYRHTARREVMGGYLSYDDAKLHIGVLTVGHRYRQQGKALRYVTPQGGDAERLESSIDWRLLGDNFSFFGESLIRLRNRSRAATALGISFRSDALGTLTFMGRYLGTDYVSAYAMPEAHYSGRRNEKALSVLWAGGIASGFDVSLFVDLYRSIIPYSRRDVDTGVTVAGTLGYRQDNTLAMLRLRAASGPEGMRYTARATFDFVPQRDMLLRMGMQVVRSDEARFSSTLFGRMRIERTRLLYEAGVQFFHIQDNPFVADVAYMPHKYHTPLLRGSGIRVTAKVRLALAERTFLYLRCAPVYYLKAPSTPLFPLLDCSFTHRI